MPTYSPTHFRQSFMAPMALYRVLERELPLIEPSLLQQTDCTGRPGHPLNVKLLDSLRRLGTGRSFQDLDDHTRMSIESQRQTFNTFLRAVRARFGPRYLNRWRSFRLSQTCTPPAAFLDAPVAWTA